jgi:hypothetical protein
MRSLVPLVWGSIFSSPPPAAELALTHVNVVPMDTERVLVDQTVLVRGDRIVAVGPNVVLPRDATVIDLTGRWVIPGLADMHVHVNDEYDLPLLLAAGVTTAVNMSGSPRHLVWRDAVRDGVLVGPTLLTTGPMLDRKDDLLLGEMEAVRSPEEAAARVKAQKDAGYDFIKMHGDLEVAVYDGLVDEARRDDIRVVGHLSERVGLLHSMQKHQSTVEHAEEFIWAWFDDSLDASTIPAAVEATLRGHAYVTPTLVSIDALVESTHDHPAFLDPSPARDAMPRLETAAWENAKNPARKAYLPQRDFLVRSLSLQRQLVGALASAGVPIMTGTDAGWVPGLAWGSSLVDEIVDLDRVGLGKWGALQAATATPGRFLGGPGLVGQLVPGARADLVVLAANPLADLGALRDVHGVMARGRWYDERSLHAMTGRDPGDAPLAAAWLADDPAACVTLARAQGDALSPSRALTLATRLLESGDAPEAQAVLEIGAEHHPDDWALLTALGRVLALRGDVVASVRALDRARLRAPLPAATALVQRSYALAPPT